VGVAAAVEEGPALAERERVDPEVVEVCPEHRVCGNRVDLAAEVGAADPGLVLLGVALGEQDSVGVVARVADREADRAVVVRAAVGGMRDLAEVADREVVQVGVAALGVGQEAVVVLV